MSILIPLLLIAVMVGFNALYVAAEFATVGSRRSRVQEDAASGDAQAQDLLSILVDPKRLDGYVAACQIGITLSSLVAGAYGQAALTPLLEDALGDGARVVAVLIVLAAITSLQVVIGELLPKTAALRYPEKLATATLLPMRISQWLFRPLVAVFNGTAFALMRWWGLHAEHSHAHVHSPEELAGLYKASAEGGLIDAAERDMLAGVLNVEDRLVGEIMTPRRMLATLPAHATVGEALTQAAESPHSRFPVVGDGDDIVGVVGVRELFRQSRRDETATVGDLAEPPVDVVEVAAVPTLWQRLSEHDQHCALVVNEWGSVVGMVTLEDAVEEIFGELLDEFDTEQEPIASNGGRATVRGDVLVEALVDRFDLATPAADVDTVGGLVWHHLGRQPRPGDEVRVAEMGLTLRVETMEGTTVTSVSFALPGGGP